MTFIPILMHNFLTLEFMRYSVSLVLYIMSVAMTSFEFATVCVGGLHVANLTSLTNEIARYKIKYIRMSFNAM